jgi:hypothetical protein
LIRKQDHTFAKIKLYPRGHGQAVSYRRPWLEKGDGIPLKRLRLARPHPMSFKEQKDNLRRQAGRENAAGRKELGKRVEAIQSQEGARRTNQTFTLTKEHIDQVN